LKPAVEPGVRVKQPFSFMQSAGGNPPIHIGGYEKRNLKVVATGCGCDERMFDVHSVSGPGGRMPPDTAGWKPASTISTVAERQL
jgi:hypothetical protein